MHKIEQFYEDETKSHVQIDPKVPGEYHTEILRYARLVKYKANITIAPIFFNPAPWDVFGWIKENCVNLPTSS